MTRVELAARRWWPVWAVTLVACLAVGVALALQPAERLQAVAGDVVQGRSYRVDADGTVVLQLPSGPVEVEVGEPLTGEAVTDERVLAGREEPDDGSFVAVSLQPRIGRQLPGATGREEYARVPIEVQLVADGRTYRVPRDTTRRDTAAIPGVERNAYVAVAGRPSTLVVAVSFDGVRQTVVMRGDGRGVTGAAAPLYDEAADTDYPSGTSCGTPRVQAGFTDGGDPVDCTTTVFPALPWLPSFGWAPAGYRWLAIGVRPEQTPRFVRQGHPGDDYYGYRSPALRVTLDGTVAVDGSDTAPTLIRRDGFGDSWLAVFRVRADTVPGRLSVTATWPGVNGGRDRGDGAPVAPTVSVSWTGELT